ncbi:hypothetical protein [Desulfitibacter alkalitolerans]|nr:hypothetical protein [Desulfitibacter alkalitolerans]
MEKIQVQLSEEEKRFLQHTLMENINKSKSIKLKLMSYIKKILGLK